MFKKSFLSVDAIMAVFIMLMIYQIIIQYIIFSKNIAYDYSTYLQIISSIYSTSFLITELTSINPSGNNNEYYLVPSAVYKSDTYYDYRDNQIKTIGYNLENYVLYTNVSGTIYATTTFGVSNNGYFYTLNGGGQEVSDCNYNTGC